MADQIKFDISDLALQPADGDLCEVESFDPKNSETLTCKAIWDAHRGVFFRQPGENAGQRAFYKSDRVRNVLEFRVIEASADPTPNSTGVINHQATAEAAKAPGATETTRKPAKPKAKAKAKDDET